MSSSISQAVRELAEPKLAEFTAKLIPTVDPARILGVRMPALRKLAKKLLREHPQEVAEFKAAVPHDFQEEDLLHVLLLNEERDFTLAGFTSGDASHGDHKGYRVTLYSGRTEGRVTADSFHAPPPFLDSTQSGFSSGNIGLHRLLCQKPPRNI